MSLQRLANDVGTLVAFFRHPAAGDVLSNGERSQKLSISKADLMRENSSNLESPVRGELSHLDEVWTCRRTCIYSMLDHHQDPVWAVVMLRFEIDCRRSAACTKQARVWKLRRDNRTLARVPFGCLHSFRVTSRKGLWSYSLPCSTNHLLNPQASLAFSDNSKRKLGLREIIGQSYCTAGTFVKRKPSVLTASAAR